MGCLLESPAEPRLRRRACGVLAIVEDQSRRFREQVLKPGRAASKLRLPI